MKYKGFQVFLLIVIALLVFIGVLLPIINIVNSKSCNLPIDGTIDISFNRLNKNPFPSAIFYKYSYNTIKYKGFQLTYSRQFQFSAINDSNKIAIIIDGRNPSKSIIARPGNDDYFGIVICIILIIFFIGGIISIRKQSKQNR